ncbi:MAG TPA: hypothetical protein VHV10_16800, partial [Ktedonobacteraceae bacterium]|nr:hypothetical protein [Ktedonobacteraceae bacterium]
MPFITTDNHSQSLDNGQVSPGFIVKDWFSGNADGTTDKKPPANSQQVSTQPGHLVYTYLNDTVNQPGVQTLLPITLGIGFAFISPVLVLIGYQLLWASWIFGRANAMEVLGRLILSGVAILASYELAAMLISLTNQFNLAIV